MSFIPFSYVMFPKAIISLALLYCASRLVLRVLRKFFSQSPFHGIPGPLPQSWAMGNLGQLFNAKGLQFHLGLVDKFGGMVKVYGFFGDEQLYISDPRALQTIISKDQDAFEETSVFTETNKVIFGPGLVSTIGEQHKRQRKIVAPMFSVSQLRQLTPLMYDLADKLVNILDREAAQAAKMSGKSVLDMSDWMCRVALEIIGQTILGYSFDPLDTPHTNPYTSAIKELIPTIFSLSLVRQFAPFLVKLGPPSFRRQLVEWTPNKAVQKVKDMSDVMHQTAQTILKKKRNELLLEDSAVKQERPRDLARILLKENDKAKDAERMSDAELTGQMTVLVFGAQDTTSSSLSRTLHQLATYPETQTKLRDEIRAALHHKRASGDSSDRFSYDEVMALPLLDAVLKETLRLYPPVVFVRRNTVKETVVPYSSISQSTGNDQGPDTKTVTIPVGTTIFVSIGGSNRLESVWGADAKEWKPERWLTRNDPLSNQGQHSRPRLPGIYSGMMSFFGGGRSCIGYKFAQVEMKIILVTLLMKFTFTSTEDEIVWNLSQIISPSVRTCVSTEKGDVHEEKKGLPLTLRTNDDHVF